MIRWATDRIAMGGVHDVRNAEALAAEGIGGILCLDWFPIVSPAPGLQWVRRPLYDGAGNSRADILDAVSRLDGLLDTHERVLVHCREGVSRTPFLVACHLEITTGEPLACALERLEAAGYLKVDPGLLETWRLV